MAESKIKNMNNQHIVKIGATFLKTYLAKIEELTGSGAINSQEAIVAKVLGQNAFNTWSVLFSDKRSPFYSAKLPTINEDSFGGMIKAFSYFVVVEFEEIFHALHSPFQDQSVKDVLKLSLADISKERISEIVSIAVGGEDAQKHLSISEKFIADTRFDHKNPQEEMVEKYFFGIRIMFDDPDGNIIKNASPKLKKDVEELALEIYKKNAINLMGLAKDTNKNANSNLTQEEQKSLDNWASQMEAGEMAQVQDLIDNCNITFQFAKTHSVYLKDWEKTKERMENNLKNGVLPPDVSANLHRAIIDSTDEIIQRKLKRVRDAFEKKFGESIYNYLGPDGKTKKLFGIFG